MNFLKNLILYLYWWPFRSVVRRLPPQMLQRLSVILSHVLYHAAPGKRLRMEKELTRLVPEMRCPDKRKAAIKDAFRVLMGNEMEVLCYDRLTPDNISGYITCQGLHHIDQARAKGKGAILLFAHFGANQMVMPCIGHARYPMSQISAPATVWTDVLPDRSFSIIEKKVLKIRWHQELSLPVEHINVFGSLKPIFRCLKNDHILGVALDGGWGKDRVMLPFFKQQIFVSKGAAALSLRLGAPILPTFVIRTACGKNKMIIESPLTAISTKNQEAATVLIKQFIKRLEHYVTRYPGHYLNFAELRQRMAGLGDPPLFSDKSI